MDETQKKSSWNIERCRDLVRQLYDVEQLSLAAPSLRSIDDRQRYAHFHYSEMTKLYESFVADHLADACLLSVALGASGRSTNDFHIFTIKVGAHFTACIQSLHAVADILAYAIYHCLALNFLPSALKPRDISVSSVVKRMQGLGELAKLQTLLEELSSGGEFAHLSALVNVGKHRSVVRASLSESYVEPLAERYTLLVPEVEFKGALYPQVPVKDFLRREYGRCSVLTIEIGNALNDVLVQRRCYLGLLAAELSSPTGSTS